MRTTAAFGRHIGMALLEALLVATLLATLIAGAAAVLGTPGADSAFAAKGGGKSSSVTGTSSLALVVLDSDGTANHGDRITFTVSTTATDRPFVSVNCYQGDAWVYTASAGFFADYPWPSEFTLASGAWTSGGADCLARLYSTVDGTKTTTLATLTFRVDA